MPCQASASQLASTHTSPSFNKTHPLYSACAPVGVSRPNSLNTPPFMPALLAFGELHLLFRHAFLLTYAPHTSFYLLFFTFLCTFFLHFCLSYAPHTSPPGRNFFRRFRKHPSFLRLRHASAALRAENSRAHARMPPCFNKASDFSRPSH